MMIVLSFTGICDAAESAAAEAAEKAEGPAAVVEKFNHALLESMKIGPESSLVDRQALLKPVMKEVFAFDLMARLSTGRYWRKMSAGQQQRLTDLYWRWSTVVYASRFDAYKGQRFEVATPPEPGGSIAAVSSRMIKNDGESIPFLFKLKKNQTGWQIVDIHVKGVSQLANTRAQFTSVLEREGFKGLEEILLEKIAASAS